MKYPETEVYDMENILIDLVEFSAKLLVVGGRLVFWLPTARDTYKPEDIPVHPQFRLVANSEQNFGKWARRLITMEKIVSDANGVPMSAPNAPGHARFRERYFAAFNDSP